MSAISPGSDELYDVELRAVTKRFGSLTAVDAVNLKVRKGEFLSLLGPSGCGKTTSLRLIAGFEQPDEGEVLIGGKDAVGTPPYRRDVNTVFQHYALFPHMSVLDNVAYGLKQRKVGRAERYARAREALELVRMTGRETNRPTMLSGGQQRTPGRSCCTRRSGSASRPRSTPSPRSCSASPWPRWSSPPSSCAEAACAPVPARKRQAWPA
jgi:ABC-type transporter Mla maintaining outer membrane lipid asymmetry ATPase subunit MlaF